MAADKRAARLGVLALVGMLLFGLVGARLWFLQTVEQESLQAEVNQTKLRTVPLLPERGRIFDAEGRILADNDRVLTVGVDWEIIRSETYRTEIFRRLSGWVDVPIEEMEARYDSGIYSPFLPMPVAEDVKEPTAIAIQERIEDLPGVSILEQSRRVYPFAPLASHVVGYMGPITAESKDYYEGLGYFLNERVGQFGIELSMEDELHGTWGSVTYEVDNANRIVREVERVPPLNGTGTPDATRHPSAGDSQEPVGSRDELRGARVPGVPGRGALQGPRRFGGRRELSERADHRACELSHLRQSLVRGRPRRRQVRTGLPVGRRTR
jgi:penicillin-binding protein 2